MGTGSGFPVMGDPLPPHAATESAAIASVAISRMRFASSLFMILRHSFILEGTHMRLYVICDCTTAGEDDGALAVDGEFSCSRRLHMVPALWTRR